MAVIALWKKKNNADVYLWQIIIIILMIMIIVIVIY